MPEPGATTVALGRTHLSVSKLCFGTSALGDMPDTYGYEVDEHRAKETIRAIFAGPVNFLDTSRNYVACPMWVIRV
jgi:D-threo-aldose 1-dehydrogenase